MNLQTNYFILYDAIFFVVSLFICIHAYRIFRHILFIDKKKKHGPLSFINHLGGLCIGLLEVCVVLQCWFAFVELPFVENGKAYEAQSMVLKGKNVLQEEVKLLWNTKIRPSITN